MTREIGKKGKHGETDRQIVFTILLNQFKDPRGLTKNKIAEIVENATGKDREGIRKRIMNIIGDHSPLNGIIHSEIDSTDHKRHIKIELRNLKDTARLFNFLKLDKDEPGFSEIYSFILENYRKYEAQIVDFLYLWDPLGSCCYDQYNLPFDLEIKLEHFPKTEFVFDPNTCENLGPRRLKKVALHFGVFYQMETLLLLHEKGFEILFNLIEKFESFKEKISLDQHLSLTSFKTIWLIEEIKKFSGYHSSFTPFENRAFKDRVDFYQDILPIFKNEVIFISNGHIFSGKAIFPLYKDKIVKDYAWFLELWKEAWEKASNSNIFLFGESVDSIVDPKTRREEINNGKLKMQIDEWYRYRSKLTKKDAYELEMKEKERLAKEFGVLIPEINFTHINVNDGTYSLSIPVSLIPSHSHHYIYPSMIYHEDGDYYEFKHR